MKYMIIMFSLMMLACFAKVEDMLQLIKDAKKYSDLQQNALDLDQIIENTQTQGDSDNSVDYLSQKSQPRLLSETRNLQNSSKNKSLDSTQNNIYQQNSVIVQNASEIVDKTVNRTLAYNYTYFTQESYNEIYEQNNQSNFSNNTNSTNNTNETYSENNNSTDYFNTINNNTNSSTTTNQDYQYIPINIINNDLNEQNLLLIEKAVQSVNQKFNPMEDGYEFDSIVRLVSQSEQAVSGFNYIIKLRFKNSQSETQFYEVIIKSIPQIENSLQILKCEVLEENNN